MGARSQASQEEKRQRRVVPAERNLIEIASYFGLSRHGSLRSRLATWLPGGKYAGLFDNDQDRFTLDARFCYFNTTRIIQDEAALLAVLEYLFHRIDLVMDGEPFLIVLEEGWKLSTVEAQERDEVRSERVV